MYETVTYEKILGRMMERVPDSYDKREGSVIYTALAPAAAEMQLMYIEFDTIFRETFADTASREYLARRAAERGLAPEPAAKAVLKAVAVPDTVSVPVGERFTLESLYYKVTRQLGPGEYQVECETEGVAGNGRLGNLVPVGNIPGLQTICLSEVLIPGEEAEETEHFRKRYFDSFLEQSFGGNRKDYKDKTNAIAGVGSTKVTRAYDGPGTVRLTILDSSYEKASEALVFEVQQAMDPAQDGAGDGLAPIDHVVTVDTVQEQLVEVRCHLTFDGGYSFRSLQDQIGEALREYLLELRRQWADQNHLVVRVSQIESRFLKIQGIVDIGNTMINGVADNLELTTYQVPVYGGVTVD